MLNKIESSSISDKRSNSFISSKIFALPTNSNVKLTVVNALGQVVSELVNGELNAGIHDVTWSAANMTSGIYFYTIQADNFVQTRKMLLLK